MQFRTASSCSGSNLTSIFRFFHQSSKASTGRLRLRRNPGIHMLTLSLCDVGTCLHYWPFVEAESHHLLYAVPHIYPCEGHQSCCMALNYTVQVESAINSEFEDPTARFIALVLHASWHPQTGNHLHGQYNTKRAESLPFNKSRGESSIS